MADKGWARRCPPGGFGGRPEGACGGGHGCIPRAAAIDEGLTPEAKALYFYFCSLAGQGDTASPGRDNTLADMGMSKTGYYPHLKILLEQGYIAAAKGRSGSGRACSAYTLAAVPAKYQARLRIGKKAEIYAKIRASGIMALGCGRLPTAAMRDPRLTATAKAIYGYLASFADAAGAAYPRTRIMLYHLGISETTYYKHQRLLARLNYITASNRLAGGRFTTPEIVLNAAPDEGRAARSGSRVVAVQGAQGEGGNSDIFLEFLLMDRFWALPASSRELYAALYGMIAAGEPGCRKEGEMSYSVTPAFARAKMAACCGVSEEWAGMAVEEMVYNGGAWEGKAGRIHFFMPIEAWDLEG